MDLEHKAGAEGRALKMRTDAEAKKAETRLELARCNARLDECRRALREVKVSIECAVSKMFKGRRVNVMGEIGNAIEK
jgi:transposase-like protein